MTRAKAKEMLEEAGYASGGSGLTGVAFDPPLQYVQDGSGHPQHGVGHTQAEMKPLEAIPYPNLADFERALGHFEAMHAQRLAAAERNIILLTALLRAVSPARFGLSQTLEQMCKEAGLS